MLIENKFNEFFENIKLNNLDKMETSVKEIAKKLNKAYYEKESDSTSNIYIVGSVGRKTAIKNSSDLDIIFDLPNEIYKKFDGYESNGQSALLQDVKKVLSERYPKTKIRGDGQVVVINFSNYTIELVPAFKQNDNRFKYPDTHEGGSWKYTDPLSEQDECSQCDSLSNEKYFKFCHLIRAWKNKVGFKFGGLLIDTLVYNCFSENDYYKDVDDSLEILKSLLTYLKSCKKDQSYWFAVGSNQKVYNTNNGKFVDKAEKAYKKIEKAKTETEINNVLRELLGNDFPKIESEEFSNRYYSESFRNTEQFIENMFPVDIIYDLSLDCRVSQNGFRDNLLSIMLKNHTPLKINKSLTFYIKNDKEIEKYKPYDIYWKVRNVGYLAEKRDCIRGQVYKTNQIYQNESTNFRGEHYVECYIVKDNICVARAHIDVPISSL